MRKLCEVAGSVAFMSGAALENRLSELHVLVTIVQPNADAEVVTLLKQIRPAPAEVTGQQGQPHA